MKKEKLVVLMVFVFFVFSGCQQRIKEHPTVSILSPFENRNDAIFSPSGNIMPESVVISPNGAFYVKEIEPYGEGIIGIFDKDTNQSILNIKTQEGKNDIKGVAWSPDSNLLAVMYHGGAPSGVSFYEIKKGELIRNLEIFENYHFMVFGKNNHNLILSKDGYDYTEINLRNTDFTEFCGANLPWINYGWDVGRNPWGGEHKGFSSNFERVDQDFIFLKENGVKLVRVFIFCDLRSGIIFNESGIPVSFDKFVEPDFNALLEVAAKTGVSLIPVLFDYTIANGVEYENGIKVGEYRDLFTNPIKKKGLLKIFAGFFKKYGNNPSIFAWDIINEPEHIPLVPKEKIDEFINDFVRLARKNAPKSKITVGFKNRANLFSWGKYKLDIYQFHYFDSFESVYPLNFPISKMPINKPVFMGELESTNIPDKLRVLWENGYKGGLFWGLNDGNFRENAHLFRSWLSIH